METLDRAADVAWLIFSQADLLMTRLKTFIGALDNHYFMAAIGILALLAILFLITCLKLLRAREQLAAGKHEVAELRLELEREKIWRKASGDDLPAAMIGDGHAQEGALSGQR